MNTWKIKFSERVVTTVQENLLRKGIQCNIEKKVSLNYINLPLNASHEFRIAFVFQVINEEFPTFLQVILISITTKEIPS
jgi:hypothetical protein